MDLESTVPTDVNAPFARGRSLIWSRAVRVANTPRNCQAYTKNALTHGGEVNSLTLRNRVRARAHVGGNRSGVRGYARTDPPARSQGPAEAPFSGAGPRSPGTA